MMRTPVFDTEHHILGYLEHSDGHKHYRDFTLRCARTVKTALGPFVESVAAPVERVRCEWASIGVARTTRDVYYARVLVTDATPEQLNLLPGFKWFAEEHGERAKTSIYG